ncbi:MAG: hypothetical protein ACREBT_01375, partial [Thermoplasmata archaeon]
ETNSTSGATITFQEVNGSYPYEVASAAPWAPIVATGIVDVQGGDVATAVAFEFTYTVTFSESGLPPGASWNASLGTRLATGAGARIAFPLVANGSYAFNASAPNFLASPAHGLVVVVGADTSFPLVFVPISPAGTYTVSFAETRLPASSSFSVTFDGSTTVASGLVSFTAVAPGSYGYSVASAGAWVPWTNASGTVEVTNASQVLEVAFEFTYAVLFTATGLSSAVDWTVTVIDPTTEFAAAQTSSTPSIVFDLPNGTYAWTVNASGGYTPSPSVGVTTVSGSGHTAAISLGSPGGSSSGIAAWVWIVLAAVIVVVVAAVALAVIRRRRPPAT